MQRVTEKYFYTKFIVLKQQHLLHDCILHVDNSVLKVNGANICNFQIQIFKEFRMKFA